MLWTLAGFLTALGLVLWIVGSVLDYVGIAVIGAALVLGTGAMVTDTGLEYRTGETRINETADQTSVQYEFSQTDTPQQLSLGGLWMLVGGLLMIQKLGETAL